MEHGPAAVASELSLALMEEEEEARRREDEERACKHASHSRVTSQPTGLDPAGNLQSAPKSDARSTTPSPVI